MDQGQTGTHFEYRRSKSRAAPYTPPVVKLKRRPAPLVLQSYNGIDAQQGAFGISPYGLGSSTIYTPGPLSTLHTASSFTYSEPSEPASAYPPLSALSPTVSAYPSRRQSATLFGLSISENSFGPQGGSTDAAAYIQDAPTVTSDAHKYIVPVAESDALPPSAPHDPLIYIAFNPWTFPEYLLLQSIVISHSHSNKAVDGFTHNDRFTDWNRVARTLNTTSASFSVHLPYRTAWDCWHRYSIPWLRPSPPPSPPLLPSISVKPANDLYPDAPGVQRTYTNPTLQADMHQLIETYTILTKVLSLNSDEQESNATTFSISDITSDVLQAHDPPRESKRFRHPDYPSLPSPPNVPPRTLGHTTDRGLSPWFHASAVDSVILSRLFPDGQDHSTASASAPDQNPETMYAKPEDVVNPEPVASTMVHYQDQDQEDGFGWQVRLPIHLRGLKIPRPRVAKNCAVTAEMAKRSPRPERATVEMIA